MKTDAIHHLKKSFTLAIGILACAFQQSAIALNLGYLNTVDTLDLSTSSLTDTAFTVCSTNSAMTNTVLIGVGQELRINGNVTVGTNVAATASFLTMSGGGLFVVDKTNGVFQVDGATGSSIANAVLMDMGGLDSFSAKLGTGGIFRVGGTAGGGTANPVPTIDMIILATNSTISTGTISLGQSTENVYATLKLGSGVNTLNVNAIALGYIRTPGILQFNTGSGTVKIRGYNGTDTDRANLTVSDNGSGVTVTSFVDFSGHWADVVLNQAMIGRRNGGSSSANVNTGNFIFNSGTLNMNTVVLGCLVNASGSSGYGATGNMILTGGVTVVNSGMIVATNAWTNNIAYVARGTLTVGGTASVTVNSLVGPAIIVGAMAKGSGASQTATGTVVVTGGTLTLGGDLAHGDASTNNARGCAIVNLTGGALLMPNYAIVNVDNFTMTNAMLAVRVYAGLPVLANMGTGVLAPGGTNVVGSTIISNSYVQASTATLDIDLVSRLSYDRVTVTGAVTLAGLINVRSLSTAVGDFDVLTSAVSVSDTSTLDAGAIAAGFKKTLVNDSKTIRIYRHRGTFISFL